MRTVDQNLISYLDKLSTRPVDITFWENFYEFIILSYKTPYDYRFGVSDLFFKLKSLNISEAPELIKIYAHGMYLLAKFNTKKIYGADFNV